MFCFELWCGELLADPTTQPTVEERAPPQLDVPSLGSRNPARLGAQEFLLNSSRLKALKMAKSIKPTQEFHLPWDLGSRL